MSSNASPAARSASTDLTPLPASFPNAPLVPYAWDPSSPLRVLRGIVLSTAIGAGVGAYTGYSRRQDPMRAGVFLGRQGLVVGIAFFGLREYLITPLMVGSRLTKGYARRDDELKGTCRVPTFTERRCYNLFDSTLAAGITGACLSVFLGGRIGRLETSRIFAGAAFIGQLALNEVGVTRVKILAWKAKADQEEEELPKPTDLFAEEDIPKLPTSIRQALEERSKSPDARRGDSPLTTRILTGMTKVLPIRKIDDLEYFASLQKRSKDLERKIAVIDAEQARLFEVAQKGQ